MSEIFITHPGYPHNPYYEPNPTEEIDAFIIYDSLISNEAARLIASWYSADTCSPRGLRGCLSHPNSFTTFTSSGAVTADLIPDIDQLLIDIEILDPQDTDYPDLPDQRAALQALKAHVLSYFEKSNDDDE